MVKLSERPQDLTFFSFHCYLDGPNVDNRVTMAEDFKFQFCARFLQHLLNVTDNTVEAISATLTYCINCYFIYITVSEDRYTVRH